MSVPRFKDEPVFVAGHRGLVGSAVKRRLESAGYSNLLVRTRAEVDLTRQDQVEAFFAQEKPTCVILAAAKVGFAAAADVGPLARGKVAPEDPSVSVIKSIIKWVARDASMS